MRKYVSTFFILWGCVCASAQGHKHLDSLKYILPEFCRGNVVFADKQVKSGLLNISPIDQSVYCVTDNKDTLYIAGYPDIISVGVAGRYFMGWKDSFVEIVASDSGTGVGVVRSTMKINNVKPGAYGMASSTSSVKSYSVDPSSGSLHNIIIDDPRNYSYSKTAWLLNNGKFMSATKKSFEKLFPTQKTYIESVWADRDIKATDIEAVLAFYNELRGKK